jgi:hypothetical protein
MTVGAMVGFQSVYRFPLAAQTEGMMRIVDSATKPMQWARP